MRPIALAAMVLFITACSQDPTAKNVATTNELFEAFNRQDWEAMAALYAEDARFLDPSYGKDYVVKSRNETVAKYAEMQKFFPDIHDEVIGIYPAADVVTVEFVSTGKTPDGVTFRLPIVSVLTFENGIIVRDATYYDLENP